MTNLQVNFVSQWDPDAELSSNDCGATCVKMVLAYYGENHTTDEIFKLTGAGSGVISVGQLMKAISALGFKSEFLRGQTTDNLKTLISQNLPPIALVHYEFMSSRQDQTYKKGHFLVPVGYHQDGYFVNDPDFWGDFRKDGDHHNYLTADFERSWASCYMDSNPNNCLLVIYPKVPITPPEPPQSPVTDQTKILIGNDTHGNPWGDNGYMEVQAIRSVLNAQKTRIEELENQLLDNSIVPDPTGLPETPEPVANTTPPTTEEGSHSINRFVEWIHKMFEKLAKW